MYMYMFVVCADSVLKYSSAEAPASHVCLYMYMLRPDSQPLTGFQAGQTNQRLENVN